MKKRNNGTKTLLLISIVLLISSLIIIPYKFIKYIKPSEDESNKTVEIVDNLDSCDSYYNLPVVVIDTKGQNIEFIDKDELKKKTPRYEVELSLYDVNSEGRACIDDSSKPVVKEKVQIGVRGQSSLTKPKKQFSLKFLDEIGEEKDVSILDMPADDEWVLNGMSSDSSLIRNYLAYHVSGEIMNFAPDIRFVEVYILDNSSSDINNASYRGVYMFMEKISRSTDRVDITKADERYADTSFIIARDKIKEGDQVLGSLWGNVLPEYITDVNGITRKRSTLTYVYPGKNKITKKQQKIIDDYINNFELSLYSRDFTDEKKGYRKYIDVLSFVDFAIINEFFKNVDGGDVSTYFYKDIGGRLHAGPVWDFDLTLGLPKDSVFSNAEGFRMFNTIWFEQLFRDPYFVDMYITRYKFLRKNILSEKHLFKLIDDAVEELGNAIQRNNNKWKNTLSQQIDYDTEIRQIKDYITKRANWIDHNTAILYRMDVSN